MTKILDTYMYIFFIQSLNDYSYDLLNEPSTYSEVISLDYLMQNIRPIRLTLSEEQVFELGIGSLEDGKWKPLRAEWLEGTEISRWVAILWNPALETTINAMKPGDQIELTMSNSDSLSFTVKSLQEMTMDEVLASNTTRPNLVVVVYNNKKADGLFWVIEAVPEG